MNKWLKRIRGGFGMGLICAVGFGMFVLIVPGTTIFDSLVAAILGFIGGGVFSVAIAVAGRRRRFDEMSPRLFAALGSLVPPSMFVIFGLYQGVGIGDFFHPIALVTTTFFALMGAGFGAGALAIARMAQDQELLEAGEDVADIGLTKEEKRELLGR